MWDFPIGLVVKNSGDADLTPGLGRSPGERKWQTTPVFLPGKSQSMGSQKSQMRLGD